MKILAVLALLPLFIILAIACGAKSIKDILSIYLIIVIGTCIMGLFIWGAVTLCPDCGGPQYYNVKIIN